MLLLPGIFNFGIINSLTTDLKNSNSTHFIQGFQSRQNLYNLLVMLQGSSLSPSSAVIWQSLLLLFQKAIKSFDSKSMAEFCVHRHILQVGLSSSAKHKHMAFSSQLQSAKFARMSYRPKQHSLLSLTFQSFIGF